MVILEFGDLEWVIWVVVVNRGYLIVYGRVYLRGWDRIRFLGFGVSDWWVYRWLWFWRS